MLHVLCIPCRFFCILYVLTQRLATSSKVSTLPMSTTSRKALAWSKQAWPDRKTRMSCQLLKGLPKPSPDGEKSMFFHWISLGFLCSITIFHIHIIIFFCCSHLGPSENVHEFFHAPWCVEHAESVFFSAPVFSRWMVSWSPKFYQNSFPIRWFHLLRIRWGHKMPNLHSVTRPCPSQQLSCHANVRVHNKNGVVRLHHLWNSTRGLFDRKFPETENKITCERSTHGVREL